MRYTVVFLNEHRVTVQEHTAMFPSDHDALTHATSLLQPHHSAVQVWAGLRLVGETKRDPSRG